MIRNVSLVTVTRLARGFGPLINYARTALGGYAVALSPRAGHSYRCFTDTSKYFHLAG
jgi:hypothetical protein